jgi:chromosome segregation ATPase
MVQEFNNGIMGILSAIIKPKVSAPEEEVVELTPINFDENITPNQVPQIVSQNVEVINNAAKQIKTFKAKAESAKQTAISAYNKEAGFGLFKSNQKNAIEALQGAVKNQAETICSMSTVHDNILKAQAVMANSIKGLFMMGCMSLTANRMVVRELELKMKNARPEQLSELARQELQNTLTQLKAQEDTLVKQEKMGNELHEQSSKIKILESEKNSLTSKIANISSQIKEIVELQDDKIKDFDSLSSKVDSLSSKMDDILSLNKRIDELQDCFVELSDKANDNKEHIDAIEAKLFAESKVFKIATIVAICVLAAAVVALAFRCGLF